MASKLSSSSFSNFKLTSSGSETAYGLKSVGIRAKPCPSLPSLPDLVCPFCGNTDIAVVVGKVTFMATMGGDDLFNGKDQPLVTVVCSKSHFFFLRKGDLCGTKSLAA
jgi:hypothetical protein